MTLLAPSASAFSLFRKKPAVEGLPPSAQSRPSMLTLPGTEPIAKPHQVESSPATGNDMAPPAQPSEQATPQPFRAGRMAPLDALKEMADKGIYSPELQTQDTPVTRAQLAEVLVKALKHDITLYSEFPFYRDVPVIDPAYVPIEVARAKRLIDYPGDHGFYHPAQPIRFGELYLAISHTLTGRPPAPERAEHLLRNIPERKSLSESQYASVSKMAQARFFSRVRRHETRFQPVENEVTPQAMASYISFMMFLNQSRSPIGGAEETLPELPAGLTLVVSPSTGIMEERLKSGGRIRFQLVNAVETIPKGSMVRGTVQEALPNRTYRIVFDAIRTTEGQNFATRAELSIAFSARDKLGFIVPGETFEVVTQSVSSLEQVEPMHNGTDASPPPLTPQQNVPNRDVLKQPTRTIPQ